MAKELDELLKQTSEWMRGVGPASDMVISSRIRLARNLDKLPFSTRATKASQLEILNVAKESINKSETLKASILLEIGELNEVDRQFLVERHLVSREHIVQPDYKAVAIGKGEVVSVMINEEDHLRIQAMQSGLNLPSAWTIIDAL